MWFKKKWNNKDNKQFNMANQKNQLKGGINIENSNSGMSAFEQLLISRFDKLETKFDKLDEKLDDNTNKLAKNTKNTNKNYKYIAKIKKGLNYYIQNNSVEDFVKDAANEILK